METQEPAIMHMSNFLWPEPVLFVIANGIFDMWLYVFI